MGKKKKKAGAKLKVPKEIVGVKVPKGLRKQAKALIEVIDSPAGRELAIAGLTLAASSLAARAGDDRTKRAGKAVAATSRDSEVADLGAIISQAAAEGARRFLAGFEEGRRKQAETADSPRETGTAPARVRGRGKAD